MESGCPIPAICLTNTVAGALPFPDGVPAQWSDGRPILAGDFVYAWRRILNPATAAYLAPVYFSGIRDIRAVDELTFQVDLFDPNPIFVNYLWVPVFAAVPRHAIEAAGKSGPRGIVDAARHDALQRPVRP